MDDLPIKFLRTNGSGDTYVSFKEWIGQRKKWLEKGLTLFSTGIQKFKIDLTKKDLSYTEDLLKNIMIDLDSCLTVLSMTDDNPPEEHAHLIFENIEKDIEIISERTTAFQNLGGFEGLKSDL